MLHLGVRITQSLILCPLASVTHYILQLEISFLGTESCITLGIMIGH